MPRIYLAFATLRCCLAFAPPRLTTPLMVRNSAPCPIRLFKNNDVLSVVILYDTGIPPVLSKRRSRTTALSSFHESFSNEEDHAISAALTFEEYLTQRDESSMRVSTGEGGIGEYRRNLGLEREVPNVGDPQVAQLEPMNITQVMTELQAIQSQGPKKYCILGTRHCSFLHQQIVEMMAYALVLSGNHLYTSGAAGTNAAAIRGALRAFQPQLLTVVLPQSMSKQTPESQELLQDVTNVVTMPQNDAMPLDVASRICNSHLLSQTDHLISFAFHESKTVLEAAQEAQKLDMLVTLLYLD